MYIRSKNKTYALIQEQNVCTYDLAQKPKAVYSTRYNI